MYMNSTSLEEPPTLQFSPILYVVPHVLIFRRRHTHSREATQEFAPPPRYEVDQKVGAFRYACYEIGYDCGVSVDIVSRDT